MPFEIFNIPMTVTPSVVNHACSRITDDGLRRAPEASARIDILIIEVVSLIEPIHLTEHLSGKQHEHAGNPVWIDHRGIIIRISRSLKTKQLQRQA